MRITISLGFVVIAALLATPSQATIITIDRNTVPPLDGLSLSQLQSRGFTGGDNYDPSIQSVQSIDGTYGMAFDYWQCYGNSRLGGTSRSCREYWSVLEIGFDAGTDFVQIRSSWNSDAPALFAYDSLGNELFSCIPNGVSGPGASAGSPAGCLNSTSTNQSWVSTLTLRSDATDISRVVFGGWAGAGHALQLTYSVPEPGTLALFALGILGLVTQHKRRLLTW